MSELRAVAMTPETYCQHKLHGAERAWPETNCYIDLWIGLLHAIGEDPHPLLGIAAAMQWEGDHFSFLKPNAADIQSLTGAVLQELALWDSVEHHVAVQLARKAVPLLEVDAWFLPDTQGTSYRLRHTKTTIAILAQDSATQKLEYLHNSGLFRLSGEDYAGVLGLSPHGQLLFPYAEIAHLPVTRSDPMVVRSRARSVLGRLAASRGTGNPIEDFAADLPALLLRNSNPERVHALCFNTVRQFGATFGLLGDHLAWLDENGSAASLLADQAKTLQFRLARAARKGQWDHSVVTLLQEMHDTWLDARAQIDAAWADSSESHPGKRVTP